MKKIALIVFCVSAALCGWSEEIVMKNNVKAWSDRAYIITNLAETYKFKNPVPVQKCSNYTITLPENTKKALLAICAADSVALAKVAKKYNLKYCNSDMYIGNAKRPKVLKYSLFAVENPPQKIDCRATKAGGILLALNDDVPAIPAPAAAE